MGPAASLLMIAAGAIMTWAVTTNASGFSIHTVGIILRSRRALKPPKPPQLDQCNTTVVER